VSRRLPIFPLGAVLVPAGLLPIRLFEPRYLAMMEDLVGTQGSDPAELGVVGIERGHEVGGGELRYRVGTLARLLDPAQQADGYWTAILAGVGRFRVEEWLEDDPYPLGVVTEVEEPAWDEADSAALAAVQTRMGKVLALAVETGDLPEPVTLEWAEDPAIAAWQACSTAPIGPFDRQRVLEAATVADRLALLSDELDGAADVLTFRRGGR
jgi:uncharacterized protein